MFSKSFWVLLIGFLLFPATPSWATSCDTDCGARAEFEYPCPTLRNPGRKCRGRNPAIFTACQNERSGACDDLARQLIAAGRADAGRGQCIESSLSSAVSGSVCAYCVVSSIVSGGSTVIFCSATACILAAQDLVHARDNCL